MKLEQNRKYQAKANLSAVESMMLSNEAIKLLLVKEGFRDVSVTGTGQQRQASGIWNKPSIDKPLPKQISEIKAV